MKTFDEAVELVAANLDTDDLNGVWCARADSGMVNMIAFVYGVPVDRVYLEVETALVAIQDSRKMK